MIDKLQAIAAIKKNIEAGEIKAGPADYKGKWLFSVFTDDDIEGQLDTFYAIDQSTGEFSGFSILDDPEGIIDSFENALEHSAILEHYGVKGMRWGYRKDDAGGSGTSSATGPSKGSVKTEAILNAIKPALAMTVPKANISQKAITVAQVALKSGGHVSLEVAKKSFISPTAIAGYAVSAIDTGAYRVPGMTIKNAIRGGWPKDASLANPKMSVSDIQNKVVKSINPQYPGLGTTNNCLRCTYTYEMRRRGFDVASTKTIMASGQTKIGQGVMTGLGNAHNKVTISKPEYKGIVGLIKNKPSAEDAFKALSKEPERSRGELQMSWGPLMGGHSVAYEIIGGKPVIFDTQSSKTYKTPKELTALTSKAKSFNYTRLDNKNLNQFALPAWIKDAS